MRNIASEDGDFEPADSFDPFSEDKELSDRRG